MSNRSVFRGEKPLRILKAMWDGVPLEYQGYTFYLWDREDGRGKALVTQATKSTVGATPAQVETVGLGFDIPVNDFLVMLEGLPDEEAMTMLANAALTAINRNRGPSRQLEVDDV